MHSTYSSNDSFDSGAFLLRERRDIIHIDNQFRSLFLTRSRSFALKAEVLQLINNSSVVLKICSFIITDKEIFDAIMDKVKGNKVAVFILTQLDANKITNSDLVTEEEVHDQSSARHLSNLKKLYDKGAHVRASTSAHAKFICSDRKLSFLMSANLTTPSLSLNTESGVYLAENCARNLDRLFDVVFQKGTNYRKYITATHKKKQFIVHSEVNVKTEWLPREKESGLRFTYEQLTHNLLNEILNIIRSAKKFIYISSFSIVHLERIPDFVHEINKAIERHVKVLVFCRAMNHRRDHLTALGTLCSIGCNIYGDYYNHSKGIINENAALLFTANIDGAHGLTNGFEVGYLLDNDQRDEFLTFHNELIETAEFTYRLNPMRADVFATELEFESVKGKTPPEYSSDISIQLPTELISKCTEIGKDPIYIGKSRAKKNETYLISGNNCFTCSYNLGCFTVISSVDFDYRLDKYLLKYKTLKIFN